MVDNHHTRKNGILFIYLNYPFKADPYNSIVLFIYTYKSKLIITGTVIIKGLIYFDLNDHLKATCYYQNDV